MRTKTLTFEEVAVHILRQQRDRADVVRALGIYKIEKRQNKEVEDFFNKLRKGKNRLSFRNVKLTEEK